MSDKRFMRQWEARLESEMRLQDKIDQQTGEIERLREAVTEQLDKISKYTGTIRGDWTDPSFECEQIWAAVEKARTALTEKAQPSDDPTEDSHG